MRYQEQGKRIGEMQQVGEKIVTVNTIFDRPKGVLVEFLNAKKSVHVKTAQEFRQHYQDISFYGWTKLGTVLREKIVVPLVHNVPSKKRKPLLISIITDGNVSLARLRYIYIAYSHKSPREKQGRSLNKSFGVARDTWRIQLDSGEKVVFLPREN